MADTTWRMFVGPAVLTPVGIFADLKFQTKPWLTILAAVAGFGISILLVRQQLRGSQ
jgi:F0F1-type ATP synthase assembly protein I